MSTATIAKGFILKCNGIDKQIELNNYEKYIPYYHP